MKKARQRLSWNSFVITALPGSRYSIVGERNGRFSSFLQRKFEEHAASRMARIGDVTSAPRMPATYFSMKSAPPASRPGPVRCRQRPLNRKWHVRHESMKFLGRRGPRRQETEWSRVNPTQLRSLICPLVSCLRLTKCHSPPPPTRLPSNLPPPSPSSAPFFSPCLHCLRSCRCWDSCPLSSVSWVHISCVHRQFL